MRILVRYLKGLPPSLWLYWGFLLGLLFVFALLAREVLAQSGVVYDEAILTRLEAWQSGTLDAFAWILDVLGGSHMLVPATLVVAAALWRVHPRSGVFFGLAVLGAVALNGLAKLIFERTRPELFDALVPADGYAFPSGHAMGSTAFALAACLVVRYRSRELWWPTLFAGAVFALAVGASRSYLQVHYPSDVLAGWILSTAWVLGVNAWYARTRTPRTPSTEPEAQHEASEAPPTG